MQASELAACPSIEQKQHNQFSIGKIVVTLTEQNTLRRIFFSSRWAKDAIVTVSFSERFAFSDVAALLTGCIVSAMVPGSHNEIREATWGLIGLEAGTPGEG